MLWTARTPELFMLFADTWRLALDDYKTGQFTVALWADESTGAESCDLPYCKGRPDFKAEVSPRWEGPRISRKRGEGGGKLERVPTTQKVTLGYGNISPFLTHDSRCPETSMRRNCRELGRGA
jgi:hypothetical protein